MSDGNGPRKRDDAEPIGSRVATIDVVAEPAMEYEVFVHGALCYAVSGNCMASGMMIGRFVSVWGQIGLIIKEFCSGKTIGPPADRE